MSPNLRALILLLIIAFGGLGCQQEDSDTPQVEEIETSTTGAPPDNGAECPPPTTIGPGLGAGQVPYLVLAPSGMAFGSQQSLLVNEFNRKALELANDYCMPCVANYLKANQSDIVYGTREIGRWTELTIQPTGGRPKQIPPNTRKRAGFIDPPSPNVECIAAPPLPPPPEPPVSTIPPSIDMTNGGEEHQCRQPTEWKIPQGTIIAENSWPVPPGPTGGIPWQRIQAWLQNVYPGLRAAKETAWITDLQRKCNEVNPDHPCIATLEIDNGDIKIEQGETGTAFGAPRTIYVWRAVLKNDITGRCELE